MSDSTLAVNGAAAVDESATLRGSESAGRAGPLVPTLESAPESAESADRGRILDSPRYALIEAMAEMADARIGGGELFATLTWRDVPPRPGYNGTGLGTAMRDVGSYLADLSAVYPGVAAFFAWEEHRDRVTPHAHGLLSGLGSGVARAVEEGRRGGRPLPRGAATFGETHATDLIWREWFQKHGIARIEEVRDGQAAAGYAAKYCLKEMGPWRIWLPGELRAKWSTGRRRGR